MATTVREVKDILEWLALPVTALQMLFEYSIPEMTHKYCELFNVDIVREYDRHSPLAQMKADHEKIKI